MAENFTLRGVNGTHASNTLSHGTFGTATYDSTLQSWSFLRSEFGSVQIADEDDNLVQGLDLEVLSESEVIFESSDRDLENALPDVSKDRYITQVSLISSLSLHTETHKPIPNATVGCVSRFAIGEALWLRADGVDSGNLTLPVTAYVSGLHKQELQLACHGRKTLDRQLLLHLHGPIQIPQVLDGPSSIWSIGESIEQVVFSPRRTFVSEGTMLAVRHISGTTIFQPLLRKGNPAAPGSRIDPNVLLTIPNTSTGGVRHADIAFAPHDQRILAVIDIQGNWSSWKIRGRRTQNARNISQAQLLDTGKLFSWDQRRRPANTELYFDGWHRVAWSGTGQYTTTKLLFCNRKDATVLDIDTGTYHAVNLKLDIRKQHACILDAISIPRSDLCLLLSTKGILLYSLAPRHWQSANGPFLVCAWSHGRSPEDLTLKLAVSRQGSEVLILVYSGHSSLTTFVKIRLAENETGLQYKSYLPVELSIPRICSTVLSSLVLAHCEISARPTDMQNSRNLYQVISQYEDSQISQTLLSIPHVDRAGNQEDEFELRLPPNRSVTHDSGRYLNTSEDEDDILAIPSFYEMSRTVGHTLARMPRIRHTFKQTPAVYRDFSMLLSSSGRPGSRVLEISQRSLGQALNDLQEHLENETVPPRQQAILLTDMIAPGWQVTDIDADAARIDATVSRESTNKGIWYNIGTDSQNLQLPDLYESLFTVYIGQLPPIFPSRFRISRERLIRSIAFEQHMSAWAMRKEYELESKLPTSIHDSQPDSQILSDPLIPPDLDERPSIRSTTSASQPESRRNTLLPLSMTRTQSVSGSQLDDALARLKSFTKIKKPPTVSSGETSQELNFLLDHIPADINSDPNDYDWQAQELMTIARREGTEGIESSAMIKRKARLERAQKKAQLLRSTKHDAVPQISSSTAAGADLAALPIRTWPKASGRPENGSSSNPNFGGRSQPVINAIMSDGLAGPGDSSQNIAATNTFSATQPVRGAFAQRPDPNEKGRAKKRRRAGF